MGLLFSLLVVILGAMELRIRGDWKVTQYEIVSTKCLLLTLDESC
jgi:hypothetical protein